MYLKFSIFQFIFPYRFGADNLLLIHENLFTAFPAFSIEYSQPSLDPLWYEEAKSYYLHRNCLACWPVGNPIDPSIVFYLLDCKESLFKFLKLDGDLHKATEVSLSILHIRSNVFLCQSFPIETLGTFKCLLYKRIMQAYDNNEKGIRQKESEKHPRHL